MTSHLSANKVQGLAKKDMNGLIEKCHFDARNPGQCTIKAINSCPDQEGVLGWISIARGWRHRVNSLLVRVIVSCYSSNVNQPMFHGVVS